VPPTEKYRRKAPAFIFGARCPLFGRSVSPAPNTYLLPPAIGPKIPDKLAAAEVTLYGVWHYVLNTLLPLHKVIFYVSILLNHFSKGKRTDKLPEISPGPIYDVGC